MSIPTKNYIFNNKYCKYEIFIWIRNQSQKDLSEMNIVKTLLQLE